MCIRYCDDGDPSGVDDIITAITLGIDIYDIYQYLTYSSVKLIALIGQGGDRADTLEYLRWYPEMWKGLPHYSKFCQLYDDNTKEKRK